MGIKEQKVTAHRKATALNMQTDIGPPPDNLGEQIEQMQDLRTMFNNERYYNPEKDLTTIAKNGAALTAGGMIGAANALYDLFEYGARQPGGVSDKPLPKNEDTIWDAFTDENIARSIGGDPNHWSWLPLAFIMPGGEKGLGKVLKKDIVMTGQKAGDRAVRGMRQAGTKREIMTSQEAEAAGYFDKEYDPIGLRKSGWYKDDQGIRRFVLPTDTMTVTLRKALDKHPRITRLREKPDGTHTQVIVNLEELIVDGADDLWNAYPGLRKLPVILNVTKTPDGLRIQHFSKPNTNKGQTITFVNTPSGRPRVAAIEMINSPGKTPDEISDSFKETLFHEMYHTIQGYEGWSNGGNAAFGQAEFNLMNDGALFTALKDAVRWLDNAPSSVMSGDPKAIRDFYKARLTGEGYSEYAVDAITESTYFNLYARALKNSDIDVAQELSTEIDTLQAAAVSEMAWVLDSLRKTDMETREQAMKMFAENLNRYGPNFAVNYAGSVYYDGYLGIRGEREARLVGGTVDVSLEDFLGEEAGALWLDVRGPNPFDTHSMTRRGQPNYGPVPGQQGANLPPEVTDVGMPWNTGVDVGTGQGVGPTFKPKGLDEIMPSGVFREGRDGVTPTTSQRITDMELENVFEMPGNNKMIPVMINPTGATEVGRYLGKHVQGARSLRYLKTKNDGLILWDGDEALHEDIAKQLGIEDYLDSPDVETYGTIDLTDANPMMISDYIDSLFEGSV